MSDETSDTMDGVRIHKAPTDLQDKVGTGQVSQYLLHNIQEKVKSKAPDFAPVAKQILTRLVKAVIAAKKALKDDKSNNDPMSVPYNDAVLLRHITAPVMELKANAPMFDYKLLGDLAGIMLSFVESTSRLDKEIVDIIEANIASWNIIIQREMKGEGGEYGYMLRQELQDVCERYLRKRTRNSNKP